jgi:hypothetical protein
MIYMPIESMSSHLMLLWNKPTDLPSGSDAKMERKIVENTVRLQKGR